MTWSALTTPNAFVTSAAGFQFASPAWLATMRTVPVPLKVTFVPPDRLAGPDNTLKPTGNPELTVALRPSRFVVICVPGSGNVMDWLPWLTTSVAA